ncbi:MAG: hypothetical protein JEZ02_16465 [Desulfatibacillum sp.]|nr:hypothetical protein [Desulfatibacillum sp.]
MKAWICAALLAVASVSVYSYPDALKDMVPGGEGAQAAEEFLGVLKQASASLDMAPKIQEFNTFVYESASRFSIDKLYESGYLDTFSDGSRGLVFQGESQPNAYTLKTGPLGATPGRGGFVAEFGLQRKEDCPYGGLSFSSYADIRANTMRMSDVSTLALHEGFLKVVDPKNFHDLQALRTRRDRHIKMEALMVLREFYTKFPHLSRLIQLYTYPLHSEIVTREFEGQEYTVQNFRVFLKLDAIKGDFPFLGGYLEDFRDLFRSEVVVSNTAGNTIMKMAFDSQKDIFSFSMLTRNGKVIPFDAAGAPVFAQEMRGVGLEDLEFTVNMTLYVNVFGIKFTTENIDSAWHYHREGAKGRLDVKLTNMDRTHLFGKAKAGVPDWVRDLAIPKAVDDLLFGFTRLLVEANNGEGTWMTTEWDTSDPENVDFHLRTSTELLDNYYVRFAAAAIKYCFQTDGNTRYDMERLLTRTLDAILEDTRLYMGSDQSEKPGVLTDAPSISREG